MKCVVVFPIEFTTRGTLGAHSKSRGTRSAFKVRVDLHGSLSTLLTESMIENNVFPAARNVR